MGNEQVEAAEQSEAVFTKEQIVNSTRFKDRKDLLAVTLDDSKTYTIKQIESALKKSLARKVN